MQSEKERFPNFAAWRLGERHPIPFRTEESAQAAQICRHSITNSRKFISELRALRALRGEVL
jgi:hypothetical protein